MSSQNDHRNQASESNGAARRVTPTPRKNATSEPAPDPTRPVVEAPVAAVVSSEDAQTPERHPQRREGNLSHSDGVKVIHTSARDLRRRQREARKAEEERLSAVGVTSDESVFRRNRRQAQAKNEQTEQAEQAEAAPSAGSKEAQTQPSSSSASRAAQLPGRKARDPQKPTRRTGGQAGASVESDAPAGQANAASAQPVPAGRPGRPRNRRASQASQEPQRSPRDVAGDVRGAGSRFADYVRTHTKLVVVLCVVAGLLVVLYGPVRDYYVAWRRQGVLQSQYQELTTDHDNLESDVNRLQSREGVEDEARRQGYGYSGESTLNVEGIDDDPNQGSSPLDSTGESTQDVPWYVHVADFIFFYPAESQG